MRANFIEVRRAAFPSIHDTPSMRALCPSVYHVNIFLHSIQYTLRAHHTTGLLYFLLFQELWAQEILLQEILFYGRNCFNWRRFAAPSMMRIENIYKDNTKGHNAVIKDFVGSDTMLTLWIWLHSLKVKMEFIEVHNENLLTKVPHVLILRKIQWVTPPSDTILN